MSTPYFPLKIFVRERKYWIYFKDDENVVTDCSRTKIPPDICTQLTSGWDYVFFVEDFKPYNEADKDHANAVVRVGLRDGNIIINPLNGQHNFTLDLYYGDQLLTTLMPRRAKIGDFDDLGVIKMVGIGVLFEVANNVVLNPSQSITFSLRPVEIIGRLRLSIRADTAGTVNIRWNMCLDYITCRNKVTQFMTGLYVPAEPELYRIGDTDVTITNTSQQPLTLSIRYMPLSIARLELAS